MKKVYEIATVHGMCGGVFAALQQVEKLLQQHRGEAVYILHELVHNRQVSAALASGGAVFIDDVSALPPGAVGPDSCTCILCWDWSRHPFFTFRYC